jgi:prephenate dehydrogenase
MAAIGRLCIIGLGLIGGSLARALRASQSCGEIVGCDQDRERCEAARALGVVDRCHTAVAAAVAGADIIVLSVPLGAMETVFAQLAVCLPAGAVVTDVGSAKASVIAAMERAFAPFRRQFVPGHPIAGTEKSGVEASFASLFSDRVVILTPTADTAPAAIARVADMWRSAGARVEQMEPLRHDQILAATSHLPHVLAYTLVDMLSSLAEREAIFRYAAGGFRDFTRIASSDPHMWHDICFSNADALAEALEGFHRQLGEVAAAIRRRDGDAVKALFARAKASRDRYAQRSEAAETKLSGERP